MRAVFSPLNLVVALLLGLLVVEIMGTFYMTPVAPPRAEEVAAAQAPAVIVPRENYDTLFAAPFFFPQQQVEAPAPDRPLPLGVVETPEGRRALVRFTGGKKVKLMAPGDEDSGWKLIAIGDKDVEMKGPEGAVHLAFPQGKPEEEAIGNTGNE